MDSTEAQKFFGKYGKKDSLEKTLDVVEEPLNKLFATAHEYLTNMAIKCTTIDNKFEIALESIANLSLTKAEGELFCTQIEFLQGEENFYLNISPFISAVIQKTAKEDEIFALSLKKMFKELNYLCCCLEKRTVGVVGGDVGECFGYRCKNSSLTIYGSVDSYCAFGAENSSFLIYGDAGFSLGEKASGCTIKVDGEILEISPSIGRGTEITGSVELLLYSPII